MIATLDSTLKRVLSQGNAEQNQSYAPRIFEQHFNIVSDFIIDEVARVYPSNQTVVHVARPFLKIKFEKVIDGSIPWPEDCRHLLGVAIFIAPDKMEACEVDLEEQEIVKSRLIARSNSRTVTQVEQFEWDDLISHPYKPPTLENSICSIFTDQGIRIAPFDVPMVELRYLVSPKLYQYGYTMNPDDTYFYDENKSIESEWTDNAANLLFKGVNILYSNYIQNTELASNAQLLKNTGLL